MRSQALYKLTTTNPVEPLGKINVFRLFPKTPKTKISRTVKYSSARRKPVINSPVFFFMNNICYSDDEELP